MLPKPHQNNDVLFMELQNSMLTDLLSSIQYAIEEHEIWNGNPQIHVFQDPSGNFTGHIQWNNNE